MSDWLTLLGMARRMVNLTQEDFASDLGVSRSTLGHWENGRRPIPSKVKRLVLDIIKGYYHHHPEFRNILAKAETSGEFITFYREGLIIQDATSYAKRIWHQSMKTEMADQPILPLMRSSMRFLEFSEKYYLKMLNKKSEIVSASYVDESLLFPEKLVKTVATSLNIGGGCILCVENTYLPLNQSRDLLEKNISLITVDDT